MGSISAVKLLQVFHNVESVLAIELFTAAQALDFRRPLRPGRGVEIAQEFVRAQIPHQEADQLLSEDLRRCLELVRSREIVSAIEAELGELG
jgi:histidine ammonia-lyase